MFDVKELPLNKSVLKEYAELSDMFYDMKNQLGSFETLTSDQVVRYIVLTYHFQSPLVQSKADLMWRKKQAMLLAGVKTNQDGFFCEEAMNIIANRNAAAIDLKMRFIRFENNLDWVELSALTEVYYDYIRTISDESQSTGNKTASDIFKVKQAIIKESEGLKNKIDTLSSKVFKGDIELANYIGSTIVKEERRLRLSPELNAEIKSQTNGK
jgi:hypothetical protein